jgi:hypothetical protein
MAISNLSVISTKLTSTKQVNGPFGPPQDRRAGPRSSGEWIRTLECDAARPLRPSAELIRMHRHVRGRGERKQ